MKAVSRHILYGKSTVETVVYDMHASEGELRSNLVRHSSVYGHL